MVETLVSRLVILSTYRLIIQKEGFTFGADDHGTALVRHSARNAGAFRLCKGRHCGQKQDQDWHGALHHNSPLVRDRAQPVPLLALTQGRISLWVGSAQAAFSCHK
jgi:hypothetical protein